MKPAEQKKLNNTLQQAAKNGDAHPIRSLIAQGAQVNANDRYKRTPLHHAAAAGHADVIELLLKSGAEPNVLDTTKKTPLHLAAEANAPNVIAQLIRAGAQTETPADKGATAMHLAAQNGLVEALAALMEGGARVFAQDKNEDTPLHHAARGGHAAAVQVLANQTPDINLSNKAQQTALHVAALHRQPDAVQALLDAGANANAFDRKANTPLHLAVQSEDETSVGFLLKKRAERNLVNYDGQVPLDIAAEKGNYVITNALFEAGARYEKIGDTRPAVVRAAASGHLTILEWLIQHGEDLDETDSMKRTALQRALENKHHFPALLLIRSGANVNPDHGPKPLELAIQNGRTDVVKALCEKGAHVPATAESGPIYLAANQGDRSLTTYLLEHVQRTASPAAVKRILAVLRASSSPWIRELASEQQRRVRKEEKNK